MLSANNVVWVNQPPPGPPLPPEPHDPMEDVEVVTTPPNWVPVAPPPPTFAFPAGGLWNANSKVVALDPGNSTIFSALIVENPAAFQPDGPGRIEQLTLGKYRHDAWFVHHQKYVERVRKSSSWYRSVLSILPSRKTANFDTR